MTAGELAAIAATGNFEVGSTGVHHRTNGIKAHVWTNAVAYEDSLDVSTSPAWVEAITGTPCRTWCTDLYQWSWIAAKNVRTNGYKAVAAGIGYNARQSSSTSDQDFIRGVITSNTVGWDRFDAARLMPWDDVGSPYAIGTIPTEYAAGDNQVGAIFGESAAGSTAQATIWARLNAAADTVRAHGNAPIVLHLHGYTVTREDVENIYLWCKANDVWMTDLLTLANYYRARHVPRDPPYWAYNAKLDGITAADSIFWGPPAPAAITCDTDSFLFSSYTTAVTRANYTGQVNEGHGFGWWDYDTQGNSGSWSSKVFRPQDGGLVSGHPAIAMGWDVSSLHGKTVLSADVYYYVETALTNTSLPPGEHNYTVMIGVTNPNILPYMDNRQSSYAWTDSAQSAAWPVAMSVPVRFHDFGDYVYPAEGYSKFDVGWERQRVTDYVQHVLDDELSIAGVMFWGKKASSNAYCAIDVPGATASKRPYLVVRTCK
jgi:hypothetical protein